MSQKTKIFFLFFIANFAVSSFIFFISLFIRHPHLKLTPLKESIKAISQLSIVFILIPVVISTLVIISFKNDNKKLKIFVQAALFLIFIFLYSYFLSFFLNFY